MTVYTMLSCIVYTVMCHMVELYMDKWNDLRCSLLLIRMHSVLLSRSSS